MSTGTDKFELSTRDLQAVATFAAECAAAVLPIFERRYPRDPRPREALEVTWTFIASARRTQLQRMSAFAAHKAAQEVTVGSAQEAARAAAHAAAAAYLHPIARATQVRHILGAAAHAARAAELDAGGDQRVGAKWIELARQRATPALIAVLKRYPAAPLSGNRVTQLMKDLDTSLRDA